MTKKILIIDDDAELCDELAELLNHEGYTTDIACDGIHGTACINNDNYDIILLDLKMPGLNGLDILRKLKKENTTSKVLIISGNPFIKDFVKKGDRLKLADGTISKPFDGQILLEKIKELIESDS